MTTARKVTESDIIRESKFRAMLREPPGAAEWLAQVVASCGREFGGHEGQMPMLLGVLTACMSAQQSREICALFFPNSPKWRVGSENETADDECRDGCTLPRGHSGRCSNDPHTLRDSHR